MTPHSSFFLCPARSAITNVRLRPAAAAPDTKVDCTGCPLPCIDPTSPPTAAPTQAPTPAFVCPNPNPFKVFSKAAKFATRGNTLKFTLDVTNMSPTEYDIFVALNLPVGLTAVSSSSFPKEDPSGGKVTDWPRARRGLVQQAAGNYSGATVSWAGLTLWGTKKKSFSVVAKVGRNAPTNLVINGTVFISLDDGRRVCPQSASSQVGKEKESATARGARSNIHMRGRSLS